MAIYDTDTYDIRNAVPPLMGRVRGAFMSALDERLAPYDVKTADYLVLMALANDVADTASSLCWVMSHDPGAMTRKIDSLEARGLVRRLKTPEDRRANRLELTPEGRKLQPKMLAAAVDIANEFLQGFTKPEVRALEDMLKRILANAEAAQPANKTAAEAQR